MGKEKGSPKTGGRKKGTPNKDNVYLKDVLKQAVIDRLSDFNSCLDKLRDEDPKAFSAVYLGLLPYTTPKIASIELTGDESKPLSVVTEFRLPKNDRDKGN